MTGDDLWRMLTAYASFGDGLLTRCRYEVTPRFFADGEVPEDLRGVSWMEKRITEAREFSWMVDERTADAFSDVLVSPFPRRENREWTQAGVLWAKLETAAQYKQLGSLPQGPTMVIRAGQSQQRWALWALATPISMDWSERANKRLSVRLDTLRKWAMPETTWIPVPGTTLRYGREKRPLEVAVEYGDPERVYTIAQVVKRLKDPPAPNTDWKAAA